ncbi:hypothetical protein BH18ACT5_BH18ACT5_06010 [soil metagenome]
MDLVAPVASRVAAMPVRTGDHVAAGDPIVILEVMKMEHVVVAPVAAVVVALEVAVGDAVQAGTRLATLEERSDLGVDPVHSDNTPNTALDELRRRHELTLDAARPETVARRHQSGHRTARENVVELCTDFVEYGPLVIAAQRGRRPVEELMRRTPADGMIGGIGRIATETDGDDRAIVVSYDYTVLAGTQGMQNHRKKDRLFTLAAETGLPVVLFAEGGGGRPGDVDWPGVSLLDGPAFRLFAEIRGPTIGVNNGFCFAGNAALLGQCDVIVATPDSNLGMGGPAMIEGGGLGVVEPTEIGPAAAQASNGVIDFLADDDTAAISAVKSLLGYTRGRAAVAIEPDQTRLRTLVPENRRLLYDMRAVISALVDMNSFVELRREFGRAAITGLGRIDGRPIGVIANDPAHLAGAIDHEAATTLARHQRLCNRWGIPILSLCDTPGFMVGPEAELEGLVRSAGDLFRVAAELKVPLGTVVTRRGYGLGAMAMAAGGFHEPRFVVGWPSSEFGAMGLEGAVRLGFKRELDAIDDPNDRAREQERRVDELYEIGKGANVASHFEIDDVIDPADTRRWILTALIDR